MLTKLKYKILTGFQKNILLSYFVVQKVWKLASIKKNYNIEN